MKTMQFFKEQHSWANKGYSKPIYKKHKNFLTDIPLQFGLKTFLSAIKEEEIVAF